jgi:hypothetical protein
VRPEEQGARALRGLQALLGRAVVLAGQEAQEGPGVPGFTGRQGGLELLARPVALARAAQKGTLGLQGHRVQLG